LQSFKLQTELI